MILTSPLLSRIGWLEHGFGTRHANLSQEGMASLEQIHSAQALRADRSSGLIGEGDALVTNRSGIALSIRTADCLPILLVDRRTRAIAAVHAGWRGTAARIVLETLRKMTADFGTNPADVHAAIGPGIGECCYEVGLDVARQFGMSAPGRINLAQQNLQQLQDARVAAIDTLEHCTRCDAEHFHSFRRDKEAAGRMISFVRILGVRDSSRAGL